MYTYYVLGTFPISSQLYVINLVFSLIDMEAEAENNLVTSAQSLI